MAKKFILAVVAAVLLVTPAASQFSDGYNFLKAVRERKGADVEKYLSQPDSHIIINRPDASTGETALHILVRQRNLDWLLYMLAKGAKESLADKSGTTPLMLATQLGWIDGIDALVRRKGSVDQTNRAGETALILAVQLRNGEAVRTLLKAGANPDRKDSRAGYSARDYAKQDVRAGAIAAIIENHGKAATTKPADLDFSGIGEKKGN